MMSTSYSNLRQRMWLPALIYLLLVSGPLVWAMSQLVNNPSMPLHTGAEIQVTAQYMWDNPQSEDDFFEPLWIQDRIDSTPEMICFGFYFGDYRGQVKVIVNGYRVENIDRFQFKNLTRGKNGRLGPAERACFVMPPYTGIALIEGHVEDAPSVFITHTWAVKISVYRGKKCLALSQYLSNCF